MTIEVDNAPREVTVPDDLPLERLVSDVFRVRRHGVYAVRNKPPA